MFTSRNLPQTISNKGRHCANPIENKNLIVKVFRLSELGQLV